MPVELINPSGLPAPDVYRQVAVATGTRTVFVSGQVARTADGAPVGPGDLAAQTEQAYRNVATALEAVGATLHDVAKMTVYVVDLTPEKMGGFGEGAMRAAAALGQVTPAITLVGVTALGEPDLLVEVEATAVLP
ncbi:RidA family protein [Actinomycetospora rhizophila]|uniref:RidA family protein n=1 Tax=Actinomycetospora rhizophila TaxID=1416876 RepID=A0ABV9ZHI6_9PSEU